MLSCNVLRAIKELSIIIIIIIQGHGYLILIDYRYWIHAVATRDFCKQNKSVIVSLHAFLPLGPALDSCYCVKSVHWINIPCMQRLVHIITEEWKKDYGKHPNHPPTHTEWQVKLVVTDYIVYCIVFLQRYIFSSNKKAREVFSQQILPCFQSKWVAIVAFTQSTKGLPLSTDIEKTHFQLMSFISWMRARSEKSLKCVFQCMTSCLLWF